MCNTLDPKSFMMFGRVERFGRFRALTSLTWKMKGSEGSFCLSGWIKELVRLMRG